MKKDKLNVYIGKNVRVTLKDEIIEGVLINNASGCEFFKVKPKWYYDWYHIQGQHLNFRSSYVKKIEIR